MLATLTATGRRALVGTLLACCAALLWHGGVAAATAGLPTTAERPAVEAHDEAPSTRTASDRTTRREHRSPEPVTTDAGTTGTHPLAADGTPTSASPSHDPPGRAPPTG